MNICVYEIYEKVDNEIFKWVSLDGEEWDLHSLKTIRRENADTYDK